MTDVERGLDQYRKDMAYLRDSFGGVIIASELVVVWLIAGPESYRLAQVVLAGAVGAKVGVINPDKITTAYLKQRAERKPKYVLSDDDASYIATVDYDATRIRPQVAYPGRVANARELDSVGHEQIDQVLIGSS
ncbi:MAG: hypothetical protein IH789_11425, partial [Acidobacteria bacterium]|nr:hypothetical protein [Acidobacteriota bacterium]